MTWGPIYSLKTFWGIFLFIGLPWTTITVWFWKDSDYKAWLLVAFYWGLHAFVLYRYYIVQKGLCVLP